MAPAQHLGATGGSDRADTRNNRACIDFKLHDFSTDVDATMKIRTGYSIAFDTPGPTPMVLMLNVHPDRAGDLI